MNGFEHFPETYNAALHTRTLGRTLAYFDELDSTNTYCKRRAAAGDAPEGLTAVALLQTAGRGRLGRVWESRQGDGLYISFLTPVLPGELLPLVPIAVGLAVAEAVEAEAAIPDMGIKWPNDIIAGSRKLAGILCEGAAGRAVCGIGVNLCQSREDFLSAGLPHATSLLMESAAVPSAARLAAAIANGLEPRLDALHREGAAALVPDFRRRCVSIGRRVRAISAAGETDGTAVDIDEAGRLVIDTGTGRIAVSAGEVQLRTPEGYL